MIRPPLTITAPTAGFGLVRPRPSRASASAARMNFSSSMICLSLRRKIGMAAKRPKIRHLRDFRFQLHDHSQGEKRAHRNFFFLSFLSLFAAIHSGILDLARLRRNSELPTRVPPPSPEAKSLP